MIAFTTKNSRRRRTRTRKRRKHHPAQRLRFTPYAWAKLKFLRDLGNTEVGGFGISSERDLLLIEDFVMIEQACTAVTVRFQDSAVADYFDDQVDAGRVPEQFSRVWIHTHPGSCPLPSGTDEETFARCFGAADWAVMFILARRGAAYGRLRLSNGPGADVELQHRIAYSVPFASADHDSWQAEYDRTVRVLDPFDDPISAYFGGDGRRQRSESLEHLGQHEHLHPWETSEWVAS